MKQSQALFEESSPGFLVVVAGISNCRTSRALDFASHPDYFRHLGQTLCHFSRLLGTPHPLIDAQKKLTRAIEGYSEEADVLNLAEALRYRSLATNATDISQSQRDRDYALKLLRGVVAKEPANLIAQDDLASTLFQEGELLLNSDIQLAKAYVTESIAILDNYIGAAPSSTVHLIRRARAVVLLLETRVGEPEEKNSLLAKALSDYRLAESFSPCNPQVKSLGESLASLIYLDAPEPDRPPADDSLPSI